MSAQLGAEEELLAALDHVRDDCAPLATDGSLGAVALDHSEAMRDDDFFGLADSDGDSLLEEGAAAASVAQGSRDVTAVVEQWLADPTVSAAILDCTLDSVGIGYATGDDGPWWTLLLA